MGTARLPDFDVGYWRTCPIYSLEVINQTVTLELSELDAGCSCAYTTSTLGIKYGPTLTDFRN
jgi:hypothetical protein